MADMPRSGTQGPVRERDAPNDTPIHDFKDLDAWRVAMRLAKRVHVLTDQLSSSDRYGLSSQMRRAAVSIPSNIAEGYGRGARQEYLRFLRIARGSAAELETQLLLAAELGYVTDASDVQALLKDVYRLLYGLIRSLSTRDGAT